MARMISYLKRCERCHSLFATLSPKQGWCSACAEASRVWRNHTNAPPPEVTQEIEERKRQARAAKQAAMSLSGIDDDEDRATDRDDQRG